MGDRDPTGSDGGSSPQTAGAILTVAPFLSPAMYWVMVARGRECLMRLAWSAAGLLLVAQFAIDAAALCDDWVAARPRAPARVR